MNIEIIPKQGDASRCGRSSSRSGPEARSASGKPANSSHDRSSIQLSAASAAPLNARRNWGTALGIN